MLGSTKTSIIITCLTVFVYPFLPLAKEWNPLYGLILEATLLLLLSLCAILRFRRGSIGLVINRDAALLVVFLMAYFFINIADTYSSFSGFRSLLLYILFFIVENGNDDNTEIVSQTAKSNLLASTIMCVGCFIQFVMPSIIMSAHNPAALSALRTKTDWTAFGIYNRTISFMTDPNVLSVYLAFSLFVIIILYKHNKSKIYFTLLLIHIASILLTKSRTGMFAVLIYIALWIVINPIRNGNISAKRLVFIATGIVLAVSLALRNWSTIASFIRMDTLMSRNGRTIKNALQIKTYFTDNLRVTLGNGLFDGRSIIFENSYLLALYMFGIVGTILLIVLSYRVFKPVLNRYNLEFILCYGIVISVGDYILIPQVTIIVILCLILNSYYEKKQLEREYITV